jgi:hypothetical protein
LSDVLREARYTPRTTLAQTQKNYVMGIGPTAIKNLANQRADIDAALVMGDAGLQIGNREAFERQISEVPNVAGMFIGPKSSAWNKPAYEKAVEMEKAGARPSDIWRETMTARGLDNKWRQEIPDTGAVLDMSKLPSRYEQIMQPQNARLMNVFKHDALEEAYPNLVNNLKIARENRPDIRGAYDQEKRLVTTGGATYVGQTADEQANVARSTLLHEIQHAIQQTENFGRGGSPESAKLIAQAQIKSELAPLATPFATNRKYWDDYGAAARSEYMVRLGDIATRENIKPRTIYNLQDWYVYGNDYRRAAGPQPKKPGAARDEWFRGAAQFIQDRKFLFDAKYQDLPYNNLRDAKNAQKRAMTQIKKTDEAARQFQELGAKQKRFDELSDTEAYRRLAGEAESRLTQTREKLSMEERKANFPFDEQYEKRIYGTSLNPAPYGAKVTVNPYGLDVPAKETVAYTQFGDPLAMFLKGKPTQDPLEMFIGFPKSR